MSTRLFSLLAATAVAATVPGAALAAGPAAHTARTKTKVYRATLKAFRAPTYTDRFGRAKLVARGRRAKITLTAHGLVARKTYRWAITVRRCTGPRLKHFAYKRLKANRSGTARASGHSRRFRAQTRPRRFVVVYQRGNHRPLMCGRLKRTH